MRLTLILAGLLLLTPLAAGVFFRLVPMRAATWHVDPATVPRPDTPNFHVVRDSDGNAPALVIPGTVAGIAARIDTIALAAPRTRLIGGDVAQGWMTYVQRSALWGFPDAVSIRVTDAGEGQVRVTAFSRSRFGYGDGGVNRARLRAWLAALTP